MTLQVQIKYRIFLHLILNAVSFSQKEMRIIKDNLNGSWVMAKYGLSERESTEFLQKLKPEGKEE